jgi:hypothetical protein
MRARLAAGLTGLLLLTACSQATSPAPSAPSAVPSVIGSASEPGDPSQLEGVWHTGVVTPDDAVATLQAAGLGEYAQGFLDFWQPGAENVFTLRISGGRWAFYLSKDGGPAEEVDAGAYSIDGNTVTIRHDEGTDTHRWSVSGNTLTFEYVSDTIEAPVPHGEEIFQRVLYMSSPWTRGAP